MAKSVNKTDIRFELPAITWAERLFKKKEELVTSAQRLFKKKVELVTWAKILFKSVCL